MSTESPSGARARVWGAGAGVCWAEKGQDAFSQQRGQHVPRTQDRISWAFSPKTKHSASLNAKHALSDGCVCVQVCPVVVVTPHDGFCYSSYGILYPPARAVTTAALHLPTSVKSLEEYLIFLVVNVFRQRFQLAGALGSASGSSVTQPCLARHQCCREPAAFRCFQ